MKSISLIIFLVYILTFANSSNIRQAVALSSASNTAGAVANASNGSKATSTSNAGSVSTAIANLLGGKAAVATSSNNNVANSASNASNGSVASTQSNAIGGSASTANAANGSTAAANAANTNVANSGANANNGSVGVSGSNSVGVSTANSNAANNSAAGANSNNVNVAQSGSSANNGSVAASQTNSVGSSGANSNAVNGSSSGAISNNVNSGSSVAAANNGANSGAITNANNSAAASSAAKSGSSTLSSANNNNSANSVSIDNGTNNPYSCSPTTNYITAVTPANSCQPSTSSNGNGSSKPAPVTSVNWFNTKFQATELGVGSEGQLYVVGVDGYLYFYDFLGNSFIKVQGDYDLTNINKVDVSYDGTPYVTTKCGDTFYLSCDHKWIRLPGCATDIAVGRAGEVFKVGCDARIGGFGVYRLFCEGPADSTERGCVRYRKPVDSCYKHQGEEKKCFWFRIEGGATNIAVAPNGFPVIANEKGSVFAYDGTNYNAVGNINASDISVSNEGLIMAAGNDNKIYQYNNNSWQTISGNANFISVAPFSQPWIIDLDGYVQSTSKYAFN